MGKWTKVGAVILVAAAGGAVAAPLVTGNMAEQRMHAFAQNPVLLQSPNLKWVVTRYESDYLGATAVSELTFRHPELEESFTLVLDHDIDHALAAGNSLLRIRTTPRIPEGRAQQVAQRLFDERSPLTVDYRMRLDGTSVAQIQSPPTDGMRELDYGAVEWKGLNGEVSVTPGGDGEYRLQVPGLRFEPNSGEIESMAVGAIRGQGNFATTEFDGIWTGAGTSSIASMRMGGAPEGDLSIDGIEFSQETSLQQGLVATRLDGRIARAVAPENEITDVRMKFSANRLAPELLQALQTFSSESAAAESEAQRQRIARQVIGRVPWGEVARGEPLITLDLQGSAGQGAVSASGKLGLNAPAPEQAAQMQMFDLAGFAHAEVSLRAPEAVVVDAFAQRAQAEASDLSDAEARSSARDQVRGLQSQGWIQADGNELFATAGYDRGQIRINGRGLLGMSMGLGN
ncbi:MAG: DUF945 family protein [Halofilum sp. (in: g-proteobacteria)]